MLSAKITIGDPTEIEATLLCDKDSVFSRTFTNMSDQKKVKSKQAVFPLNSKRLKLYQLQQLAQALELPIKAPSNDLRVLVEEKLRAMDRILLDTQVVVDLQVEGTENLSLQGQFLHVVSPVLSTGKHEPIPCVSPTHGIEPP